MPDPLNEKSPDLIEAPLHYKLSLDSVTQIKALGSQRAGGSLTMTQYQLTWAFAPDLFDNKPHCYQGTWADLLAFIRDNPAFEKGKNYICPAMHLDQPRQRARRCKANSLPRHWLAFDMDGNLSDEDFLFCTDFFSDLSCVIYETASSKPSARRFRVIVLLTRPVIEDEAKVIGELVQRASGFTGWDSSTHRAAQPVFLQPIGTPVVEFKGTPLDVAAWLAKAPPKPKPKPRTYAPADGSVFEWFVASGLMLDVNAAKNTVICPWADLHSDGRVEAVLFEPSPENRGAFGFKCLHSHCEHRSIKDIYQLMRKSA